MVSFQYVALTREDATFPYWIVCVGEPGQSREEVKEKAGAILWRLNGYDRQPIRRRRLDLVILSKSAARRAYPDAWRHYEYAQKAGIPY